MRFAYMDSQGNEVPIPSIDALALRIELGAVGPDTELYDAQADHWGPAHTHEIFHSLSRDAEEEGFMAPPPPVASAPPTEAPPESVPETEPPEAAPESEEIEEEEAGGEFDLGLTLAAPATEAPAEGDGVAQEEEVVAVEDMALDLAEPAEVPVLEASDPMVMDEPAAEEERGGFDFGDLGSGLELEASDIADEESAESAASSGFGEGMGLETEMEFASPSADFGGGGDEMQLEEPMSSFDPDAPPGWTDESGEDDVMDFTAVTAEEEASQEPVAAADVPARQRSTPKDRPSPPKFKRQRSMSGPIVSVVAVMALGVGGYYGWPIVSAALAGRSAPERPPVVMPAIPDGLLPQMRSIAESAIADVVSEVDEATRVAGVPTQTDGGWLRGPYLSNASQYGSIEAFWSSIDDFTQGMRATAWQQYHDQYVERVGQEGLTAEAAAQITERADSGFVAAESQRGEAYAEMDRVVDAALGLHDFLLQNEATIEYRPGATSATDPNVDPVLEIAAPAEQRAQLLEMFDEITTALDAYGSVAPVTRQALVAGLTARLQQLGLQ